MDVAVAVVDRVLDPDVADLLPVRVLDDDLARHGEVAVVRIGLLDRDLVLDVHLVVGRLDVVAVGPLEDLELDLAVEFAFGVLVDLQVFAPLVIVVAGGVGG